MTPSSLEREDVKKLYGSEMMTIIQHSVNGANNSAYRFINLLEQNPLDDRFALDISTGLAASEKYISSKYLYDAVGSQIFEQITQDPNYYLSHVETEILNRYAIEIVTHLPNDVTLIELGSGSAAKTRRLLEALLHKQETTLFCPIDISGDFLQENVKHLSADYPNLQILGVIADYYVGLAALAEEIQHASKLLLWLGSDIGHTDHDTIALLLQEKMLSALNTGDKLLVGIDLKKEAALILQAYGCTEQSNTVHHQFTSNLLHYINQRLTGDFVSTNFQHHCCYNVGAGRMEAYLKSLIQQTVTFKAIDQSFNFKAGELIHLHYSYKYDQNDIQQLAANTGLTLEHQWLDEKKWYSLNLFSINK
jgi:dimethylhistidine N-methyltransferase